MFPRRTTGAVLAAMLLAISRIQAAETAHFEDAPLAAVHFVDRSEGWAVGSEGVIWHSIDGGKHWERQPTGTRAQLRSICFLNPYTGWVVGREDLPGGQESQAVILATEDGGLKWRRVTHPGLPGLHAVRFFDDQRGIVCGETSERFPTGLFVTRDGGRTWSAADSARAPGWLAADFHDASTGVVAGSWGRLGMVRDGIFQPADVDMLGGRAVRAIRVQGRKAAAVGQNGMVLISQDSGGQRWGFADLGLTAESLAACDFHVVALQGDGIWVAGRPGSVVWFSPDAGQTWERFKTGQSVSIQGLCFLDRTHGWAVGDLGTILATTDGGKTWTLQRRGGQRAAVLFVHARPEGACLDAVASVGGDQGYLTASVRVTGADPRTAPPAQAMNLHRWTAAQRRSGGAAGDTLDLPLPQHLETVSRPELQAAWDRMQAGRGYTSQLVRSLTLLVRTWQPEVIVTDFAGATPEAIVVDAVREAFQKAADPQAYPEQIDQFALTPWQAKKLYGSWDGPGASSVTLVGTEPASRLGDSPRDFSLPGCSILGIAPSEVPDRRGFRLLASTLATPDAAHSLLGGITLASGGTARRMFTVTEKDAEQQADLEKIVQNRRNLQALSQPDWGKLADSGALLAQLGTSIGKLPPEQGAMAAYSLAQRYAQAGQWHLAREAFFLMVDRFPTHPMSANAYRWLVQFQASSEARRREELGHFLVLTTTEVRQASHIPTREDPLRAGTSVSSRALGESVQEQKLVLLTNSLTARKWFEGALAIEPRLGPLGPVLAEDPALQFALQASRRQLGDQEAARSWYRRFLTTARSPGKPGEDPWREAAAAELWLGERIGTCPKPVVACPQTAVKPYLDGKLDDACWAKGRPIVLRDASGESGQNATTRAWITRDDEYLYFACECRGATPPSGEPFDRKTHDADLRAFDRISLILDLDRDYQTYYHLQVDCRGAVAEDCWGDKSWNPRCFVARSHQGDTWTVEMAIPFAELTGDRPTLGKSWAVNVMRVLPGRGVQAWSLPADVRIRPEGLGLMLFAAEGPGS